MTYDPFFDVMLAITPNMKAGNPPPPRSVSRKHCTAAVTHGSLLAIVTLEVSNGALELCEHRSGFHELLGRDQDSLLLFSGEVARSLKRWRIRNLLLRASPSAGPFLAKALVYKAEAAVQLIGGLGIQNVSSQLVTGWLNRTDTSLPKPTATGGSRRVTYQRNAIETAAFGLRDIWS